MNGSNPNPNPNPNPDLPVLGAAGGVSRLEGLVAQFRTGRSISLVPVGVSHWTTEEYLTGQRRSISLDNGACYAWLQQRVQMTMQYN